MWIWADSQGKQNQTKQQTNPNKQPANKTHPNTQTNPPAISCVSSEEPTPPQQCNLLPTGLLAYLSACGTRELENIGCKVSSGREREKSFTIRDKYDKLLFTLGYTCIKQSGGGPE